ncbi:ATP-binding SpoIIE family protein phosphatase [Neptunomonas qingdaonensis]|uniref:Serine phosphatase RsbU, regulator of sigma subunit n=1 Tax=Neptunomonas qingdaonensis TaxID=1045558 RepID=A0A1I2UEC3_9GAMM|nr:SpoIIE family protein phosphatase [Neptunomonas qingdaonensis]SFG73186.1 Serine phosphatase RsbU, regulator of sigma subunit [Neptunomonas qingdaonensis]
MSRTHITDYPVAREKVLVVDDQLINRELLQSMLVKIGFDVILASNGQEAVDLFSQHLPALVLMDIAMPHMDGIEATRLIKQAAGEIFVPVIMISGLDGDDVIRRSIEMGGDDFIHRPFSYEVLRVKIKAIQRISDLYREVQRLYVLRQHEEDIAEDIFSNAIEKDNITFDQIKLHKRAASTFSGDVQITAIRPNGDINILLGDFTGHGLTSVVGALPLAETFRAMTRKGYEAEQVIAQINRKLHGLLPTGLFLAASMVTMSSNGRCTIWNGGMPDILILSAEGEVRQRIESGDPPLGIVPDMPDMNFTFTQLEPDDKILLVSDGVLEARNTDGEYFGEQRLLWAAMLGCREDDLLGRIMRAVDTFLKGHEQDDDISLIEIPGRIKMFASSLAEPGVNPALVQQDQSAGWTWSICLQGNNLKRVNPVAIALSQLQEVEGPGDHWHDIFTILTELFVNALDHGVLNLPSSLKSSAGGFTEYFAQREASLEQLESSCYVSIHLTSVKAAGQSSLLKITVQDSGSGFDHARWLDRIAERADDETGLAGRGIMLVQALCQSLIYSEDGSTVTAEYSWGDGLMALN